ncbi:MAG: 3D domain-containing protein, partial [Blautia wexlerae]
AALTAEINNADNSIAQLVQQAEEEKAAREAAQAQAEAEAAAAQEQDAEENSDDYEEDTDSYEEDSSDSQDSSETEESEDTSEDSGDSTDEDTYEENEEDSYEEDSDSSGSEDTSDSSASEDSQASSDSSSGQGKYLGNFTLTAYCNCAQCCGTAGNLTASGTVPTAGRTVAMAGVPFGTQLLINGNVYTVEDLGTPYGHVDIYCDSHSEALSFGLQSAEVYQLN